jgi:hypothetical protein
MASIVVAFPVDHNPQEARPLPMAACWAISVGVSLACWALIAKFALGLF